MSVALYSSPYLEATVSNGLVASYKQFAPTHIVPSKTRENEVQALLKMVTTKQGFDPNLKFDSKKHIIFDPKSY